MAAAVAAAAAAAAASVAESEFPTPTSRAISPLLALALGGASSHFRLRRVGGVVGACSMVLTIRKAMASTEVDWQLEKMI